MTDLHDAPGPAGFDESSLWLTDALLDALAAGEPAPGLGLAHDPAVELFAALVAEVGDMGAAREVGAAARVPALAGSTTSSEPAERAAGRRTGARVLRLAPRSGAAAVVAAVVVCTGGVAAASVSAGPESPLFALHQVLTGQPQLNTSQRHALEVKDNLRSAVKALAAGKVDRARREVSSAGRRLPKIAVADGQRALAAQVTALSVQVQRQAVVARVVQPATGAAGRTPGAGSSHSAATGPRGLSSATPGVVPPGQAQPASTPAVPGAGLTAQPAGTPSLTPSPANPPVSGTGPVGPPGLAGTTTPTGSPSPTGSGSSSPTPSELPSVTPSGTPGPTSDPTPRPSKHKRHRGGSTPAPTSQPAGTTVLPSGPDAGPVVPSAQPSIGSSTLGPVVTPTSDAAQGSAALSAVSAAAAAVSDAVPVDQAPPSPTADTVSAGSPSAVVTGQSAWSWTIVVTATPSGD